ncbi:hypothetical protein AGMMS50262_23480 [Bacteroidia bacterium]|nr:hypothetical protein AGMMS50262_23480 [Bacteroidia bacterium]
MKTAKIIGFFILSTLFYFSCESEKLKEIEEPDVPTQDIVNIKWVVKSIVENGVANIPEEGFETSYWIVFNSDTTFTGRTRTNDWMGKYEKIDSLATIHITQLVSTQVIEFPYGFSYYNSFKNINSFSCQKDTLKLYCNETDYLLFNAYDHEKE